jgi:hypothetical protein
MRMFLFTHRAQILESLFAGFSITERILFINEKRAMFLTGVV